MRSLSKALFETRIGDFQRLAGFSYGFFQIYGREILFNDFRGGICLTKKDFITLTVLSANSIGTKKEKYT